MNPRYGRHALIIRGGTGVGKTTARRVIESMMNDDCATAVLDHGWGPGEKRLVATCPSERYSDLLGRPEKLLLIELGWGNEASTRPLEWVRLLKADKRHVVYVRLIGPFRERENQFAQAHHRLLETHPFAKLAEIQETCISTVGLSAKQVSVRILDAPCKHCMRKAMVRSKMSQELPIEFWWSPIKSDVCDECGSPATYQYYKTGDYGNNGRVKCAAHVPRRSPDPCLFRDGSGLFCCAGCTLVAEARNTAKEPRLIAMEMLSHLKKHKELGHRVKKSREFVLGLGDVLPYSHEFGSAYRPMDLWRNDKSAAVSLSLTFDEGDRFLVVKPGDHFRIHSKYSESVGQSGLTLVGMSPP